MAKLTQYMNLAEISELARKMCDERIAGLRKIGMGADLSFADNASPTARKNANNLLNKYTRYLLDNEFAEEDIANGGLPTADLVAMAESGKTPQEHYEAKKSDEFRKDADKILLGTDELGNVKPLTNEDVATIASKYNYKWRDVNDRAKFMDLVRQQGEMNNRVRVVDDFEKGKPMGKGLFNGKFGTVSANIFAPTSTDEFKKQALSGNYDDDKQMGAVATDGFATVLDLLLGGGGGVANRIGKINRLNPTLKNAGGPSIGEGFRQTIEGVFDLGDEEFNAGDVAGAGALGAAGPQLTKSVASGAMNKYGGEKGKLRGAGMMSTTAQNAVTAELEQKKREIARALMRKNKTDGKLATGLNKEAHNANIDAENELLTDLEDFGGDIVKKDGKYTLVKGDPIKTLESIYENPSKFSHLDNGISGKFKSAEEAVDVLSTAEKGSPEYQDAFDYLVNHYAQKELDIIGSHFPNLKGSIADAKTPEFKKGVKDAYNLDFIGTTVVPMTKVEPSALLGPLMSLKIPDLSNVSNANINLDTFKDSEAFKKLTPEKKKLFIEALRNVRASKEDDNSLFTDQNP